MDSLGFGLPCGHEVLLTIDGLPKRVDNVPAVTTGGS
jgi:hypothetical protein